MPVADPRTADVYEVLDELSDMIEMARAVPMSDRCVISRNSALDLLDTIRGMLPRAVQEAEEILADRVGVVEDGYREAERLVSDARAQSEQIVLAAQAQQARLVEGHEVTRTAVAQAEAIQAQAWAEVEAMRADVVAETERMRRETDDYIDGKFASFEATLTKTLNTVARGRERLGERYSHSHSRH
jgi:cell division septum initiation protein DivIVA